jgi:PAS domain S-box-containing protein
MSFRIERTVASELTLWLSMITTIIAVVFGLVYYFYAAGSVTEELVTEAQRTADEFSEILVLPLFNFDQVAVQRAAGIYLASGRVNGVHIEAEGMGEVFNNLDFVSSSLPIISKQIYKDGLLLGFMELSFNDSSVVETRKRVIWTTLVTVIIIFFLHIICLRLILRRILVKPLSKIGSQLLEIADGDFGGRMEPVLQKDLNSIVVAANMMSEEIALQTRKLRENERNYREVFNATSDAIFIHDAADGSIVDVNQTMLEMYGYSRQEAMALQVDDLSRGESPYSQQEAAEMVQKALHEGPQVFKWQARKKDGTLFWSEVALKKTVIGDEQVVLATVRDISEREQLEENLRHAQKMEAIGTLAGGIAHDFNNILTAILGYTELARMKTNVRSEQFVYLRQIEKASMRARDLVRQILTFGRKQHQKKKVVRLSSIVGEALALLRSSIPVSVEIKQQLSSSSRVKVDPGQIHQVIINLCTNGYQSMAGSSGTLTISLKDVDLAPSDIQAGSLDLTPGSYVVIEVSDNGAGMNEETMDKIFEPYYTTKDSEKGTGLGLAVVHGIVKSHHGQITVNSEPGRGTTFRVYLPATDGEEEKTEVSPSMDTVCKDNQLIMVVDDEESIRSLLEQMLTHGGYRVKVFADGNFAWKALSADPMAWDLLITDLTMPNMNGAELTRKAAQLRPDMPIILCTGYNEMENGNQEGALPFTTCLQKPITIQELLATTARVLQERGRGQKK